MRPIGVLFLLVLAGCSLTAHKIEVQQGNYVDQAMIDKIKPGMTRSQVRFVLGTPLITDAFHPNRWDYIFLTGRAGDVRARRRITVVFDADKLIRVEGDVAARESLSRAAVGRAVLGRHEIRAEA